jgi:hypothetical protein
VKHEAGHPLPISYGYSASGSPLDRYTSVTAPCGRCGGEHFDIDADWIDRYFVSARKQLANERERGYYGRIHLDEQEQSLANSERAMLKMLEASGDRA